MTEPHDPRRDGAVNRLWLRQVGQDGGDTGTVATAALSVIETLLAENETLRNLAAYRKDLLAEMAEKISGLTAELDDAMNVCARCSAKLGVPEVPDCHTRINGKLYEVVHEERAWMGAELHYTLRLVPGGPR